MSPGLKRLLIYIAAAALLAIATAVSIAYFNEDRIRIIAIEKLNALLETEVRVEAIEFSLLKRFPKASIHFENIEVKEKGSGENLKNVLKANSLFLEFNPFDLLSGKYVIDRITLTDATINAVIHKNGSNNFDFIKEDSSNENFNISLEKVTLVKSVVEFRNEGNGMYFNAFFDNLEFSGQFQKSIYELNIASKGEMRALRMSTFNSKRKHEFILDFKLKVDTEKKEYLIQNALTHLGPLKLRYHGKYIDSEKNPEIDLSFKAEEFSLKNMLYLLPEKFQEYMTKYSAGGDVILEGKIAGKMGKNVSPAIDLKFSLDKGTLNHNKGNAAFDEIHFEAILSNGDSMNLSSSYINVKSLGFTGTYGKSFGSFSIVNFNRPYLSFELTSIIDLGKLRDIIGNDSIEEIGGVCEYYLKAETKLDSLTEFNKAALKAMKTSGNLTVTDGLFKWKGYDHKIGEIYTKARFGNKLIYIDTLHYTLAGIPSSVKGKVYNLIPYLFFKDEGLKMQADVYYKELNIDQLTGEKKGEIGFLLPVTEFTDLNINLMIDKFSIRRFKASNLSCQVTSNYPYLLIRDLNVNALEGRCKGWINVDVSDINNSLWTSELELNEVNINQLFYQFEEFGQENIVSGNLEGIANVSLSFKANFDKNYSINGESVEVLSTVEIKNGRLINYEPILALSKYVELEELKNISFTNLKNDIQIKNKTVLIPQMEIKSSALEVLVSGKHTFENVIDYHIRLYLNDILFKKAKKSRKNDEEFGEVETDKEGRSKIFLSMTGTVDDYKIKLDRKALREKWDSDIKSEREELNELFKIEFGKKKEKEKSPVDIGIEWEEYENQNNVPKTPVDSIKGSPAIKEKSTGKKPGKKLEDEFEEYDAGKFD